MLVDASGSMTGGVKTTSVKMAVTQLLAGMQAEDQVALAGFDHQYWGLVPFTTDRDRVLRAVGEIQPFGSTALHDALDHAARDLSTWRDGRRAVVVVTDGVDTSSQLRPDEVLARSQALDVPIYAVSVVSPVDDPESKIFTGRERPAAATAGTQVLEKYARRAAGPASSSATSAGCNAPPPPSSAS